MLGGLWLDCTVTRNLIIRPDCLRNQDDHRTQQRMDQILFSTDSSLMTTQNICPTLIIFPNGSFFLRHSLQIPDSSLAPQLPFTRQGTERHGTQMVTSALRLNSLLYRLLTVLTPHVSSKICTSHWGLTLINTTREKACTQSKLKSNSPPHD